MSEVLSRRSAIRGAAIVVVGAAAGFAIARNSAAAKQKAGTTAANAYGAGSSGTGTPLAAVASIAVGGAKILAGPAIVVVRPASGQIHGFSAICTHQGCTVSTVTASTIDCPCHGSRFDIATGQVVTGPASRPLPPIAVTVRSGEVYRA